jgi:hypothetical protein
MVALNGTPANGYASSPVLELSWKSPPPVLVPEHEMSARASESWPSPEQEFLDGEGKRLETEIATARQRAADAAARVADSRVELRKRLRAELSAARELLDEMQRQHDASIAAARADEQRSVDRILAEARHLSRVHDVD